MELKPLTESQRKTVDAIMDEVIANDRGLREWIGKCRNVIGSKRDCERNVFGECDRCDHPRRRLE